MSGLAGVYDVDGQVSVEVVSNLLDTLDYRGHDGRNVEPGGAAALGHQQFWTTPESVGERQPVEVDGVTVAFDGRIDDREGLLSALSAERGPVDGSPSDAHLFALAYHEWDTGVFERLVGVYAVAVWDERDERFLCARGPAGMRELYYSTAGDQVVVGSDPSTVLSAPGVPNEIDEGALGEFLVGELGLGSDTVYAAVEAVAPGTYVSFPGGVPSVTRFWNPASIERLSTTDPETLAEELAARLEDAIAARLRTREPPYVLLSGGLDSTTVAALAADRVPGGENLRAVSMQFEHPERLDADWVDDPERYRAERRRVEAFADEYGIPVEYYALDDAATSLSVEAYADPRIEMPALMAIEEPKREVYGQIAAKGGRIALTGELGNLFDGVRFSYYDLLREGSIRRALSDVLADPVPTRQLLTWFVLIPAIPGLGRLLFDRGGDRTFPAWLDDGFVDRVNLPERLRAEDDGVEFDRLAIQQTYDDFYRADQLLYYGQDRRRALSAGVEPRHPFADRRVLEFLFGLPPGVRLHQGTSKYFFRYLADKLLPKPVRDQSAQFRFDPIVHRGFDEHASRLETLVTDGELVERGIVDPDEARRIYRTYRDGELFENVGLWRIAATELWLEGSVTP